jgi:CRISPR/Cas system-associated exonuclease Cas4 (RecB family)
MALLKYGFKEAEPQDKKNSAALVRGREHHESLDAFIKGTMAKEDLPKELLKHFDKFDWAGAREGYANNPKSFILEEEWAWTREWESCPWMGPEVWGRAKVDRAEWLDVELTAMLIVDYKTGKKFGNEVKHSLQMQCYAAIVFMRFPTLQTVQVCLQYTDEGKETKRTYTRAQAQLFIKLFTERAGKMTDALKHKPKPSSINCAYCSYGPNNGGSGKCEYGVETRK